MSFPERQQEEIHSKMEKAAKQLNKYGYCVVPGVLTPERCVELQDALWLKLEQVSKGTVLRSDSTTHKGAKWFPSMKGIIQEPSELNHLPPLWEVRKAAAPYFAHLFGSPLLMSSFDRFNMYPALGEEGKESAQKQWLHCDQSPLKEGLFSVQGFVDLCGTGPLDAGLLVAKKSHRKHHKLLYKKWGLQDTADWHMFTPEQRAYIDEHFKLVKVECPKGSLVLWDSRAFHQNVPPKRGGHERLVVYTCMLPHYAVPASDLETVLKKKAKAFDALRTTTHSPTRTKLFPMVGRTYGKERRAYNTSAETIQQPKNDPVIQALVGKTASGIVPELEWCEEWSTPLLRLVHPSLQLAKKVALLKNLEELKKKTKKEASRGKKTSRSSEEEEDSPLRKRQRTDHA